MKSLKCDIDPALLRETGEQFDNPGVASLGGGDLECGVRLGHGCKAPHLALMQTRSWGAGDEGRCTLNKYWTY